MVNEGTHGRISDKSTPAPAYVIIISSNTNPDSQEAEDTRLQQRKLSTDHLDCCVDFTCFGRHYCTWPDRTALHCTARNSMLILSNVRYGMKAVLYSAVQCWESGATQRYSDAWMVTIPTHITSHHITSYVTFALY